MVAISRQVWERLGQGESLLFQDLVPFLQQEREYKKQLKPLLKAIKRKSLQLFPDVESLLEIREHSAGPQRLRTRDPFAHYLEEVRGLGVSNREEEILLARALEIARLALHQEISTLPRTLLGKKHFAAEQLGGDSKINHWFLQIRQSASQADWHLPNGSAEFRSRIERVQSRLEEVNRVRKVLISKNLHLVPKFARRFRHLGIPYADLIQEGNASLLRAADKFDWKRAVRFSTYAQWWVNQAMLKSLYSQSRVVRLPIYLNQKMKRIRDTSSQSFGENGQKLSAEQIAENLHEPLGRIRRALRANVGTFSIDQASESGDDSGLRDLLVDRKENEVQDNPEGPSLHERIEQVLQTLPEKERKVLVLRFGLEGKTPLTLDQVSKQFGVSRERIRQIQVQALKKLRRPSKEQKLGAFLEPI